MYLAEGWFIDGMNESIDYYNPFAFHYYGIWWAHLYGASDPTRADRWKTCTHDFLDSYSHFFAASGENTPFGRSMCYRFAASAPFALAEMIGCSPLAPGLSRQLCSKNLEFFIQRPITQSQGALSIGWTDEFPALSEAYSCAASPYWAAKGLTPLLLAPESSFWTDEAEPLPSAAGDSSYPIRPAGLLVQNTGGAVEILNTQSMISIGNTGFGTWKWSKLCYRSGFGFNIQQPGGPHPLDAALTATDTRGVIHGRHSTHPIAVETNYAASRYCLGERIHRFNIQVESHIWCRGSWHLHLHRFDAHQPALLRLGSYALPASSPEAITESGEWPKKVASNGCLAVSAQALHGFERSTLQRTPGADGLRMHLTAPCSATVLLESTVEVGTGWLAAIVWAGEHEAPSELWQKIALDANCWQLEHPELGTWTIQHSALPATL
jgi:hypothetical protein